MYEEFKIAGIISEFTAAIFATIFYYKYRNSKLKLLLFILWYIPINEMLGQYVFARTGTGYFLYNLYEIIVTAGLIFLIGTQITQRSRKRFVYILFALSIVGYTISLYFFNPFKEFSTINFTLLTIAVLISLLVYFIDLLKSDRVLKMSRNLFLWVALGFLIFFIAFPVILLAREFISNANEVHRNLNYIQFAVAILSYLTIAFGFYWGDKVEPYKNQSLQKYS